MSISPSLRQRASLFDQDLLKTLSHHTCSYTSSSSAVFRDGVPPSSRASKLAIAVYAIAHPTKDPMCQHSVRVPCPVDGSSRLFLVARLRSVATLSRLSEGAMIIFNAKALVEQSVMSYAPLFFS